MTLHRQGSDPSLEVRKANTPALDSFDRQLLEFAITWAQFGGPSEEDCMMNFGMTSPQLCARARELVRRLRALKRDLNIDELRLSSRATVFVATTASLPR